MKKSNFIYKSVLALLVIGSIGLVSYTKQKCIKGSGVIGTETRTLTGFTKIEVGGAYEVEITQEDNNIVRIETDDNIIPYILTEINDGVLKISSEKQLCTKNDIKLFVSAKTLSALKAHGAVEIRSINAITSEKFDLNMSGASDVHLKIETKLLQSKLSGASELVLRGKADTHATELSGAGELNAIDFVVDKYALKMSGASESNICVQKELAVEATGASEINYKGNPIIINKEISGAAELKMMN